MIDLTISNHSAVCLAELTHSLGRLSRNHPRTKARFEAVIRTISPIPRHRLREPSQSVWGNAGLVTGLAFRVGGYQAGQERALLNDTLIFLQGLENGQVVVTVNIGDFDILGQLVREGRVLFYRRDQYPN